MIPLYEMRNKSLVLLLRSRSGYAGIIGIPMLLAQFAVTSNTYVRAVPVRRLIFAFVVSSPPCARLSSFPQLDLGRLLGVHFCVM